MSWPYQFLEVSAKVYAIEYQIQHLQLVNNVSCNVLDKW